MALDRSPESFSPQIFLHLCSFGSNLWPMGEASFDPKGHHMDRIDKGLQGDAIHTKNLRSIPSSFRGEEFWSWSSLFPCSKLWPQGGVSFDLKGIIWIKLIKVHKEMLNTKYRSSNPSSFREEEFLKLVFFVPLFQLVTPGAGPGLT